AVVAGQQIASDPRACIYADPGGAFGDRVPCANGPGQVAVDTRRLLEGTQTLFVQAEDTAGNAVNSAPVTVRVDNTPPGRADVGVQGGEGWRNSNNFALAWSNPPENDRAPITAANYKLCPAGGGRCDERSGPDIAGLTIAVPGPGEWRFRMWRRDAAGNQNEGYASVPVTLRYDPEAPKLSFEQSPPSDPTVVSVLVTDDVSGLADGSIEIGRAGSGIWQTLATRKEGSRLLARIDDAALAPGDYVLRASAFDQARNQGSTDTRPDGRPVVVVLPIRIASALQASVVDEKIVSRTIRRRGRLRRVHRRVTVLRPIASVALGRRAQIAGRLVNRAGDGIAGAAINVYSSTRTSAEQLVGVLQADGAGRFGYMATASSSRALRFGYAGSQAILPAQGSVELAVPAASSIRVDRARVRNGQVVTFSGRLRALPVPAGGKLVELQVVLSGRWQTFRTTSTDQSGRWAIRYRFQRTSGVQHFRFRARLPRESSYPFEGGASSPVGVRVRGRR
ncbi:MAG: large repetitive protein, partial [Solirubrobacteraceae bacterium]|nr:large repetitive protein [Solirubrobacteraceae bacterium]